jgi:hypothetical protein
VQERQLYSWSMFVERSYRRERCHGFPSFPSTTPLGNFFGGVAVVVSELAEAVGGSRVSSAILSTG